MGGPASDRADFRTEPHVSAYSSRLLFMIQDVGYYALWGLVRDGAYAEIELEWHMGIRYGPPWCGGLWRHAGQHGRFRLEPQSRVIRPTIVIMPESYTWSPLSEGDAVELYDTASDRTTILRRPPAELLSMDDVVRIEALAFRVEDHPQAELFGALDTDPLRVLAGMNWLIAYWAVLWDLRTGSAAGDLIRDLDYDGPWRKSTTPEREQVWRSMSQRVRSGVLAALTGNPEAHRVYESEVQRLAPDLFLHVTLTIMDTLSRQLTWQGLDVEGMAAQLADRTDHSDNTGPSFTPPRTA